VRTQNEGATADGAIWDFLNDTLNVRDGQLWYRNAYRTGDIAAASVKDGNFWVLACAVPARPAVGIAPGLGVRCALRVARLALRETARPDSWRGFLRWRGFRVRP
jgi:hypothetical protein